VLSFQQDLFVLMMLTAPQDNAIWMSASLLLLACQMVQGVPAVRSAHQIIAIYLYALVVLHLDSLTVLIAHMILIAILTFANPTHVPILLMLPQASSLGYSGSSLLAVCLYLEA